MMVVSFDVENVLQRALGLLPEKKRRRKKGR
jgi:hypothetical protein